MITGYALCLIIGFIGGVCLGVALSD